MRDEIKKWIDELRSGKWKQGKEQLATKVGDEIHFCCLGVLCETTPNLPKKEFGNQVFYGEGEFLGILPIELRNLLKLTSTAYFVGDSAIPHSKKFGGTNSLAALNDDGFTFSEIADVVEYVETHNLWYVF